MAPGDPKDPSAPWDPAFEADGEALEAAQRLQVAVPPTSDGSALDQVGVMVAVAQQLPEGVKCLESCRHYLEVEAPPSPMVPPTELRFCRFAGMPIEKMPVPIRCNQWDPLTDEERYGREVRRQLYTSGKETK